MGITLAPAGAPTGLVNLAHLPPNCWGRLNCTRAATGIRLPPRAPSPGPSPRKLRAERGELLRGTSSPRDRLRRQKSDASSEPPPPRHPSPEVGEGSTAVARNEQKGGRGRGLARRRRANMLLALLRLALRIASPTLPHPPPQRKRPARALRESSEPAYSSPRRRKNGKMRDLRRGAVTEKRQYSTWSPTWRTAKYTAVGTRRPFRSRPSQYACFLPGSV
jgi:hypothetical protein